MTEMFEYERFAQIVDRGLCVWSGMTREAYEQTVASTGTRPGIERLAAECGITSRSLKRMICGNQPVTVTAAERVTRALPVSVAMLHDLDRVDPSGTAEVLLSVEDGWEI